MVSDDNTIFQMNRQLLEIINRTPLERLEHLRHCGRIDPADIDNMLCRYAEFMRLTSQESQKLCVWIADDKERKSALAGAEKFSQAFYKIIQDVATDDDLRYLII